MKANVRYNFKCKLLRYIRLSRPHVREVLVKLLQVFRKEALPFITQLQQERP